LGSYEVLDALLHAYFSLQDGIACEEIEFENLVDLGFDKDYVVKTIKKVRGSAYKRLQACPGAVLPEELRQL